MVNCASGLARHGVRIDDIHPEPGPRRGTAPRGEAVGNGEAGGQPDAGSISVDTVRAGDEGSERMREREQKREEREGEGEREREREGARA